MPALSPASPSPVPARPAHRRGRRAGGLVLAAALAATGLAGLGVAGASKASAATGFVSRSADGKDLTLNGAPFRYVGYNDYRAVNTAGGNVCDSGRPVLDQTQLTAEFNRFKADSGATVVRTWFFQSYYQADGYTAFDKVLAAASAAGVKIIPVLENNYGDCEANTARKSTGFYDTAFRSAGYGYNLSYKEYARTVAQHYAASTSIAYWQLANEIAPDYCNSGNEAQTAASIQTFGNEMGQYIKSVDPNHLVSLGTLDLSRCGTTPAYYGQIHNSAGIDLCEYHDYGQAPTALPSGLSQAVSACNALGKPLVIGEAGIVATTDTSGGDSGSASSTTLARRAQFFAAKIDAAFAQGVDGYLVWEGINEASDSYANLHDGEYGVGPGDPLEAVLKARATSSGGGGGGTTPACSAATVPSRFDFEDGTTQGWATEYGPATVASTSALCYSGTKALAVNLTGSGYPGITTTSNLDGLNQGSVITARVYAPASGTGVVGKLFVKNQSYSYDYGPNTTLAKGWNLLKMTVPGTVYSLGVQLDNGAGYTGTFALDAVEYARSDFEDATTGGWTVAWNPGNLSLANSSARAFTGTRSLALTLTGSSYPALRSAPNRPGLTNGTVITYRVYVPAGATGLSATPVATDTGYTNTFGTPVNLTPGAWTTVTYTWPLANGGQGVGLQINNGPGYNGTVYLDAVRW